MGLKSRFSLGDTQNEHYYKYLDQRTHFYLLFQASTYAPATMAYANTHVWAHVWGHEKFTIQNSLLDYIVNVLIHCLHTYL